AHQSKKIKYQRGYDIGPLPGFAEPEIVIKRGQQKERQHRVRDTRNPRDRFRVNRMHRKERRRKQRQYRKLRELSKDDKYQERDGAVNQHISQVPTPGRFSENGIRQSKQNAEHR